MISVRKNPNFKEWFQVFSFGKMIDEVKREARALHLAKSEGKRLNQGYIYFVDRPIKLQKVK